MTSAEEVVRIERLPLETIQFILRMLPYGVPRSVWIMLANDPRMWVPRDEEVH